MDLLVETLYQFAVLIAVFLILTLVGEFIYKLLKNRYFNSINLKDYLPEDEIHSLKQIFYLIMMALCVVNIFYTIVGEGMVFLYSFVIFDIALSLYFAIKMDKSSLKNKIIWLILIPYGSLSLLLFHNDLVIYLHVIHVLVFIYFAKLNFDKFMEYTNSNGLGVTIILLFLIIFISFFITQYAESVNALDSLVMISNEFTGNGYGIFGEGVSAATLTAAILRRHFNKRFAELEKLIEGDDE